jgi:hypothetical protein
MQQVRLKLKVMLMSERTEKMTARTEQDSTAIAFRGQQCSSFWTGNLSRDQTTVGFRAEDRLGPQAEDREGPRKENRLDRRVQTEQVTGHSIFHF